MHKYNINTRYKFNTAIAFTIFPLLGVLSFVLPVVVNNEYDTSNVSFNILSSIDFYFKNVIFIPTVILLCLFGVTMSIFAQKNSLLLGLSSMLVFPCAALYEMSINPTSHNLWPLEFIIYAFFTIPAIAGTFIGRRISKKRTDIT